MTAIPQQPQLQVMQSAGTLKPAGQGRIAFGLFLVLNAVLFIRPSEIFPALDALPIYNVVMVACVAAGFPLLFKQLSWAHLRTHPGVFCVVALLPAIVLSQVAHGDLWMARKGAMDFGRVVIYFLLLTGLVNTPARLSKLAVAVVIYIIAIAAIAELNYHGIVEVNGITTVDRRTDVDEDTGEFETVEQLYGPGIFNDPNDFSLILSTGMLFLIYFGVNARTWMRRVAIFAACAIPGYAFAMTRSRGGFLALATGLLVLAVSRFGWRRSIPVALLGLPIMLVLFGGRMTNINLGDEDDTARGRMLLWRDGFALLKGSPLLGIGYGTYADEVGYVAHNSFVHTATELGLLGGSLLRGAFFVHFSVVLRPGDTLLGECWR
jgi:hypothetical protein